MRWLGRWPGAGTQAIVTTLLIWMPALQSHPGELRERFANEVDPVRRARLMPKLQSEEFSDLRKQADAGDYPQALITLGDFRDQIRATQKELDGMGVNAEKKPSGFKELEIAVRKSLRDLDEIVLAIPADWQTPFRDIHEELAQINKHLILELFPRQPGHPQKSTKPKS
jgi:hypothetical protein